MEQAKKTAVELYRSKAKGKPLDWIAELNQIAAREVDRAEPMPTLAEVVAIERANFPPLTMPPRPPALQGDDYPLEYYEDGFPKIPDCLKRA